MRVLPIMPLAWRLTLGGPGSLPAGDDPARVLAACVAAMRERAVALEGRRRELIDAFLDELGAFFVRPKNVCDEETEAARRETLDRTAQIIFGLGRRDLSSHVPGGTATTTSPSWSARWTWILGPGRPTATSRG